MHNQRGFVGVGFLKAAVFALIIVAGGAYYVVQQQSPTPATSDNFDSLQQLPTTNNPAKAIPPKSTAPFNPVTEAGGDTERSFTSTSTASSFNPVAVEVGDTVGAFTVVRIEPYSQTQPIGPDNLNIIFKATIPVSGKILYSDLADYLFIPDDLNVFPCAIEEGGCQHFYPMVLRESLEEAGVEWRNLSYGDEISIAGTIVEMSYPHFPAGVRAIVTLTDMKVISASTAE